MDLNVTQGLDVYEGKEPYLFLSYSHRDQQAMMMVKHVLQANGIRYWYDNGLHSGDDWNMVIAKHLKEAAVCLLLLSPNSASSEYVKNELNFAMNHRIPIHTLMVKQFDMPLDIEMMTGRIQMIEMEGDYQQKLIRALPPELFSKAAGSSTQGKDDYTHQLFEAEDLLSDRQGTKLFAGKHKRLNYRCMILEDQLQSDETQEIDARLRMMGKLENRLFPRILDYAVAGHRLLVYQEYTGARFLDHYLLSASLGEAEILSWVTKVVEGIAAMYRMNLAFRDFARGSMIVTDADELMILRAYHPYYGYVKFQEETKRYYFEKELQEIAVLLAQLCLGKEPILPIRIIEDKRYSKKFLLKINSVIQKCAKENGITQYRNFEELLADLNSPSVTGKEKAFLKNRAKKLLEYDKARAQRKNTFVSTDRPAAPSVSHQSLEEEFGFDGTVVLQEAPIASIPMIRVQICSNGQVMEFDKKEILIGKDTRCDMIWTQPYISRMHLRIIRNEDRTYAVVDLHSSNGTYVADVVGAEWRRVPPGAACTVNQGAIIRIGSSEIQIL